MSTSGCGTKPDNSPWRLERFERGGVVVLVRTTWHKDSQANPYQPRPEYRECESMAEAVQFVASDPAYPLRQRWTSSGLREVDAKLGGPTLERRLERAYAKRKRTRDEAERDAALRALNETINSRARALGWHFGGW